MTLYCGEIRRRKRARSGGRRGGTTTAASTQPQLHVVVFPPSVSPFLPCFRTRSAQRRTRARGVGTRPGRAALQSPNRVTNGLCPLQLGVAAAGARQLPDYKLDLGGRLVVFQEMVKPAAKKICISSGEDRQLGGNKQQLTENKIQRRR